jgi:5,10-methylenetetrahydromethanopterin reductase
MATVHAISGGRGLFGIGRGDGSYGNIGERPPGVDGFARYLRRVQAYLRGEEVELANGFHSAMRKTFTFDSAMGGSKPPVDVACTGPRMIRIGAELGDSVSFAVGADQRRLRACIALARQARADAGLDPDRFSLGAYVQMAVAEGSAIGAARDLLHSMVLIHAHFSAYGGRVLDETAIEDRRPMLAAAQAERDHRMRAWGSAESSGSRYASKNILDPDFIHRFAIIGPPEYCAERLIGLVDLGLDRIFIGTRNGTSDLDERNSIRIAEEVFPLVRA